MCVWLIVWLVVGKMLPDDIVGFAAVVFKSLLRRAFRAALRYVAGAGTVVAPADPEQGRRGAGPPRLGAEAFELTRRRGRGRRRRGAACGGSGCVACLEVWALLAVPLAGVSLDPKKCGWLPARTWVEQEPCSGENPCCGLPVDWRITFFEKCHGIVHVVS